jgi:fatty acid desaturase
MAFCHALHHLFFVLCHVGYPLAVRSYRTACCAGSTLDDQSELVGQIFMTIGLWQHFQVVRHAVFLRQCLGRIS